MPGTDENQRRYLFVAIDRATRWVFVQIKSNKTAASVASISTTVENAHSGHERLVRSKA
jgi:hypothetical protein